MKKFQLLVSGIIFGIVLTKAEIISWFRIQEMFRFESFHMYGVIGSAVVLGAIFLQISKRLKLKNADGESMLMPPKAKVFWPPLLGGTIFGLGWAFTGACPGPLYILVGNGYLIFLVVILSAVLGTFVYGLVRHRLPQR